MKPIKAVKRWDADSRRSISFEAGRLAKGRMENMPGKGDKITTITLCCQTTCDRFLIFFFFLLLPLLFILCPSYLYALMLTSCTNTLLNPKQFLPA